MPELELWIDDDELLPGRQGSIDALFGCSSRLLKLMVSPPPLFKCFTYSYLTEL